VCFKSRVKKEGVIDGESGDGECRYDSRYKRHIQVNFMLVD